MCLPTSDILSRTACPRMRHPVTTHIQWWVDMDTPSPRRQVHTVPKNVMDFRNGKMREASGIRIAYSCFLGVPLVHDLYWYAVRVAPTALCWRQSDPVEAQGCLDRTSENAAWEASHDHDRSIL